VVAVTYKPAEFIASSSPMAEIGNRGQALSIEKHDMKDQARKYYWKVNNSPADTKMLLYTRLAPPKQPKRRSRGGTYLT
jgi:hypothetical protein